MMWNVFNTPFSTISKFAWNREKPGKKLRRIFKVEPFIIVKFKWEEIKKWKRYEKNSHKTALNILCKNKRIYPAYVFSSAQSVKNKLFS